MSRIAEFERENRDLLENLKKRTMHGIIGVTTISAGLSVANSIDPSILVNYGIIALIVYITLNIVWGIEQRHDLTIPKNTEKLDQAAEENEEPSPPDEPEKEEA